MPTQNKSLTKSPKTKAAKAGKLKSTASKGSKMVNLRSDGGGATVGR